MGALYPTRGAVLVIAMTLSCGGPIPAAETASQAVVVASPDGGAPSSNDLVEAPVPFHTITVAACIRDQDGCHRAQPGGAPNLPYRVSFGSSAGTLRSREQAIADLYREVRDRTSLGTHLAAHARRLELSAKDGAVVDDHGHASSPASPGSDPLVDAAFQLMEAVDTEGEVTLDVSHDRAGCKISLGPAQADAGSRQCLIREPTKGKPFGSEGPRDREKKFGQ